MPFLDNSLRISISIIIFCNFKGSFVENFEDSTERVTKIANYIKFN